MGLLVCHFYSYSHFSERARNRKDQIPLEQRLLRPCNIYINVISDLGTSGIIWQLKTHTCTERGGNSDGIEAGIERSDIKTHLLACGVCTFQIDSWPSTRQGNPDR